MYLFQCYVLYSSYSFPCCVHKSVLCVCVSISLDPFIQSEVSQKDKNKYINAYMQSKKMVLMSLFAQQQWKTYVYDLWEQCFFSLLKIILLQSLLPGSLIHYFCNSVFYTLFLPGSFIYYFVYLYFVWSFIHYFIHYFVFSGWSQKMWSYRKKIYGYH